MDAVTKKTLLVVEDDNVLRNLLVETLRADFNVIEAGSGEVAKAEIFRQKPDAILLDIMLPNLSGFELLELIRKDNDPFISKIKVIVLSNLEADEYVQKAKNLGVVGYITKANLNINDANQKITDILKDRKDLRLDGSV